MNKRELLTKFLSTLDRFENVYETINKKLNANKFSRKIESLMKRRINFLKLFRPVIYKKKLKFLFNKKLGLPNYLTTDSFLKGIRLLIKNKYGLTSNGLKNKENKEISNRSKPRKKLLLISKSKNLINGIKNRINYIKYDLNSSILRALYYPWNRIKNVKINISIGSKKIKADKESFTIGVVSYSDHLLTIARLILNKDNQVIVEGVIELPVQGDVIGDKVIEQKNQFSNILLDSFDLLKIEGKPILIILSSSFFNVHTFYSSELKQISNTDNTVQSKSPYLPNETFIEFHELSKISEEDKLIRTVYCNRKLIESWTDTLAILNIPIIGIVPSAPNVFDILKRKVLDQTTVLIDIELTKTTVMMGRNSYDLTSHILPYGSSLYTSDENSDLSNNYFQRILGSIELITSEYQEILPSFIYVYGKGLDHLLDKNTPLPTRFKRLSDMNLVDYSYIPKLMDIHESYSNSIESTIETLSLISSCL